jgi:hypothetical protein
MRRCSMAATRTRLRGLSLAALAGVVAMLVSSPAAAGGASSPVVTVVASGMNSPRGLEIVGEGSFLVAEAGKGGSGPCAQGPEGEVCVGLSGAITHVLNGVRHPLVDLPSLAPPDGFAAFGPHDVGMGSDGALYATVGLADSPESREQFGRRGTLLGHLVRATGSGDVEDVADLAAYEARRNPDGGTVVSNPYGLLRLRGRSVVTDAGGNSLLRVTDEGRIRTLAVFPDRLIDFGGEDFPMEAVPTSVVRGPDGAFYVSQLTGFPFPEGAARVFRVVPGERPEVYARGFTNIIDIAFDARGNLYVLEIAHNSLASAEPFGALSRMSPSGETTVLVDEGLAFPTGVALAGRHELFVTNCGICPGGGELLRVEL